MIGQQVRLAVRASNQPTRFEAQTLPAGLKLDPLSGVISGRLTQTGLQSILLRAHNLNGRGRLMRHDLEVQPLPPAVVGDFQALLGRSVTVALGSNLGGLLRLKVTANASFSGQLQLGGLLQRFTGLLSTAVNADPSGSLSFPTRSGVGLNLNFTLAGNAPGGLRGRLSHAGEILEFEGAALADEATARQGNHTLVFSPEPMPDTPQGESVAALTVMATGSASAVLRSADAAPAITLGLSLRRDQRLALHAASALGDGSILGLLELSETGRLQGSNVSWWKQARAAATSYPEGFGPLPLRVSGARYRAPQPGSVVMDLLAGAANAQLLFAGGGLLNPQSEVNWPAFELRSGHPAKWLPPPQNPAGLQLQVLPGNGSWSAGSSGSFSGSFVLQQDQAVGSVQRKAAFFGLFVDDGRGLRGRGFFNLPQWPQPLPANFNPKTSPQLSGRVLLQPIAP